MSQTEFWTAGKRNRFSDRDQDALSEEKRCFIEQCIEKWRRKYPEANLFFRRPPDGIDRMIAISTGAHGTTRLRIITIRHLCMDEPPHEEPARVV